MLSVPMLAVPPLVPVKAITELKSAVVTPKLEKRPSTLLPTVIVPACNDSVPMVSERRSEPLPTISNTLAPVLVSVPVIAKLREAPAPTLTR